MGAGVQPDGFVCILLDRVKEFPLSVIATMKAGGAYVPMDTEYPAERLRYILEDSQTKVLITSHDLLEEKQAQGMDLSEGIRVIFIDDVDFSEMTGPINLATPDGLAYMIYTSGSTGKPKGAILHHAGLRSYCASMADVLSLTRSDRISLHRPFTFDAHIQDLFPPLTVGASVHIIPETIRRDMEGIKIFVHENGITGGSYTTSLGALLLEGTPLPLRYMTLTGEKMAGLVCGDVQLFNGYGPTECTDLISIFRLEKGIVYDNIPIGRPMANSWCFITDQYGHLLPCGMAGELCFASVQVGRGYWQLPEQTAKVFVDCPFIEKDAWGRKVCMYRTGDLCRWNEQGELEYLGRIDNQVKLRGFRIELGEIESRMMKYDGIHQAVASVYDGQLLCLYYTADSDIDEGTLKEFLAQSLPDYMVPAAYIHLDELPLTPNGKIDRRRLNEQNNPIQSADMQQVSPCNKIEETLLEIAHDVLGREDFGVTDNLKLLGMNSIHAMRIAIRAQQKGYAIRVAELIKYQTIRQLHVDGISMSRWLNVQDKGKPIVVYVLGISGETESCHLMQELQDKYRVLLFENLTEIYTSLSDKNVDMLMDDYLSILHKELNGEGVHAFIGHSFGGEMAYRLAGRWSLLSDWRTQVVVLDNVPWTDSMENFWKLLKDRIDDKHLTLPKTVAERLEMSILINDIVIQMRRTSNVCPSYDLPIHLFVSTKHSGIDDVFNYINEMDTEENRTVLSEILDTDDMARTIDVEGMWHKNHKGSLTVSYIPDTHMGMLKKEYISLYLDSLTL